MWEKAISELWHIQIDTLAHYGCALFIVSAQNSLLVENKSRGKNRQKKALRTQGFDFLSVRKKVRPSAGSILKIIIMLKNAYLA